MLDYAAHVHTVSTFFTLYFFGFVFLKNKLNITFIHRVWTFGSLKWTETVFITRNRHFLTSKRQKKHFYSQFQRPTFHPFFPIPRFNYAMFPSTLSFAGGLFVSSKTHQHHPTFVQNRPKKSPIPSKDSALCQKNTLTPSISSTLLKIVQFPAFPTLSFKPRP